MENTKEINTLSIAPTDFDAELELDHMVQFYALDALRFLVKTRMEQFAETGDYQHYVHTNRLKKQIRDILNK